MLKVSVIICTHNPRRDYLQRVLDALELQTLGKEQWELLLIDNASAEPISKKYDLTWHPNSRHVREEELGLTPARLRGIREAVAEILVFVDDDNVLNPNYLEKCVSIASEFIFIGCFGSACIVPEFEEHPHPDIVPYLGFLALRNLPKDFWCSDSGLGPAPWGAGLAVRKIVAQKYYEKVTECHIRKSLDRRGGSLTSGGDDLFSITSVGMGYGLGIFTSLKILHIIPKARVKKEYILKISESIAFSVMVLNYLYPPKESYYGAPSILKALKALISLKKSDFYYNVKGVFCTHRPNMFSKMINKAEERGKRNAMEILKGLSTKGKAGLH